MAIPSGCRHPASLSVGGPGRPSDRMALRPPAWRPMAQGGPGGDIIESLRLSDLQPWGDFSKSPTESSLPSTKPLQASQTLLMEHALVTSLENSLEVSSTLWLISNPATPFLHLFFFLSLFIYFERDRHRASRGGAEREEDRKSHAGSALSARSPAWGSNPQNREPKPMT